MLSRTISFCCFSPEIFASFLAQYIYVISADILALFHPLAAESRALPVIFRAGCSSTGKDAANQKIMEEVQRFSGRNLKKVQEEIQQIIIISPTRSQKDSFGGDFPTGKDAASTNPKNYFHSSQYFEYSPKSECEKPQLLHCLFEDETLNICCAFELVNILEDYIS